MNKRAFTVTELVIVLLLVGIMAAVVVSRAPDIQGLRTQQAAYKLKSDLRYIQSYEYTTRKRTRIAFNAASESYSVYYEQTSGADDWTLMPSPLTQNNFTVDFTQTEFSGADITAVNFDGANLDLVFDAGVPYSYNSGTQVATQLSAEGSVSFSGGISVTVEPNTGKVTINE